MTNTLLLELLVILGRGHWYKLFNSQDLAISSIPDKKSILVDVAGTEVCVARNGRALSAFLNLCPHNQMPLNRGTFNDKSEWICPYHRHCFELKKGNNMTMSSASNLQIFHLKVNASGVFIFKPRK